MKTNEINYANYLRVKQVFIFNNKATISQAKLAPESSKIVPKSYNSVICLYFCTLFINKFLGYLVENLDILNQDILISLVRSTNIGTSTKKGDL